MLFRQSRNPGQYRLIRRFFLRSVFGETACRTPPPTGPASATAFWARGRPGCHTPRKAAQGAGSFRLLLRSDPFDLQRSCVLSREAEADGVSGQKSTVSPGKEKTPNPRCRARRPFSITFGGLLGEKTTEGPAS